MLKQKLLAITLSPLILSTTSLGFAQSLNTLNLPNSQELDNTILASTDSMGRHSSYDVSLVNFFWNE